MYVCMYECVYALNAGADGAANGANHWLATFSVNSSFDSLISLQSQ